ALLHDVRRQSERIGRLAHVGFRAGRRTLRERPARRRGRRFHGPGVSDLLAALASAHSLAPPLLGQGTEPAKQTTRVPIAALARAREPGVATRDPGPAGC